MTQIELTLAIQPTVLFGLVGSFSRRPESCPRRVIGAILGTRDGHEHLYEAVHSFPLEHSEEADQIAINSEQFHTFMSLHRQIHGKRSSLLGWYSVHLGGAAFESDTEQPLAGTDLFEANTLFINEFFAQQVKDATTGSWSTAPPCVCLQVEINTKRGIELHAFINGHADQEGAYQLVPIPHVIHGHDAAEAKILAQLKKSAGDTVSLESFNHSSAELNSELRAKLALLAAHRQKHPEESAIEAVARLLPDPVVLKTVNAHIREDTKLTLDMLDRVSK